MIFYRIYKNAVSATLISLAGGGFIVVGALCFIGMLANGFNNGRAFEGIVTAIIVGGFFIGIGILLKKLADKQAERVWRKKGIM